MQTDRFLRETVFSYFELVSKALNGKLDKFLWYYSNCLDSTGNTQPPPSNTPA